MADLLDPKNDYVFKRLFTAAPDLLVSLINAVRTTEVPISDVEILNPRIEPEELTGKFIVLDLLAKDIEGRQYNIEIVTADRLHELNQILLAWMNA